MLTRNAPRSACDTDAPASRQAFGIGEGRVDERVPDRGLRLLPLALSNIDAETYVPEPARLSR